MSAIAVIRPCGASAQKWIFCHYLLSQFCSNLYVVTFVCGKQKECFLFQLFSVQILLTVTVKFFFLFHRINNSMHIWLDIQPSTVTHTQNLCSAINPSKVHTHTAVNTHTHTVGGSVSYSRAPQVWYWRWRERCTFTHPPRQFLPDLRLKLATFRLRVWLSNH